MGTFSPENGDIQYAVENNGEVIPITVNDREITKQLVSQLITNMHRMGLEVFGKDGMEYYFNNYKDNILQEAVLRHTKNDISAFHLSRNFSEITNDIFKLQSERKYKKEI